MPKQDPVPTAAEEVDSGTFPISRPIFGSRLSLYDKFFSFITGILAISFLFGVAIGIRGSIGTVTIFEELLNVGRLAFVGLGTGHYLGRSISEDDNGQLLFLFGAFSALFVLTLLTHGELPQLPYGLPAEIILLLGVLFALVAHISPLIEEWENFSSFVSFLGSDLAILYLVSITFIQYTASVLLSFVNWGELDELGRILVVIGIFGGIVITYKLLDVLDNMGVRATPDEED